MRSLDARMSEPKRASLVRRWTSSVSAALSSASETWVASERRPSFAARAPACSPHTTSRPRVSERTDRPRTTALLVVGADAQVGAALGRERQERAAVVRGGAEQRAGGRGRERPALHVGRGGGARRDDLERVVLDEAQQRLGVRADERLDRVEGGEGDLVAARRGDERRRRRRVSVRSRATERSCWRTRPAMRATTRPKSTTDAPMMTIRSMSPLSITCTASTAGAIRDAPVSSARRKRRELRDAVGGRALEAAHRRVQRRGAPQQVEADPADVEDDLAVVGALERDDAVGEVGDEQRDDAQREQVEGRLAAAAVDGEADRGGEQQDVAERVGDRDELRDGAHRAVVQVRRDQRDPREQREAERHDQRVDDARAVALRVAPADEHQQARHERRVDEHVRAVAQRRERHVGAEQPRVAVRVEVAEPEEQEPDGEEPPRAGRRGRCTRRPTTIATTGDSPSRFITGPLAANGGTQT